MMYIQGGNEYSLNYSLNIDILNYRQERYESVKFSECSEKGETIIGILLRRTRFAVGTYMYNSDS